MMVLFRFPYGFSLWVVQFGQVMQTIDFDGLLATGNEVGDAAGAVAVVSPRFAWCVAFSCKNAVVTSKCDFLKMTVTLQTSPNMFFLEGLWLCSRVYCNYII